MDDFPSRGTEKVAIMGIQSRLRLPFVSRVGRLNAGDAGRTARAEKARQIHQSGALGAGGGSS